MSGISCITGNKICFNSDIVCQNVILLHLLITLKKNFASEQRRQFIVEVYV